MTELLTRDITDGGVAIVLRALATIDGLDPVECRERHAHGDAYVLFRYGRSRRDLSEFVADLDVRIHAITPGVRFQVALESVGGGTELLARLAFPPASASGLASALRVAGGPRAAAS